MHKQSFNRIVMMFITIISLALGKELGAETNTKYVDSKQNTQDIMCLAKNIYFEAGTESYKGKLAVGFVTLNRLELDLFPSTVCGVVKQAAYWRGNPIKRKCQFSWFCDGKSDAPEQVEEWYESLAVAKQLLLMNYLGTDITFGATHFHASYVRPSWSRSKRVKLVTKIGEHIFYRLRT